MFVFKFDKKRFSLALLVVFVLAFTLLLLLLPLVLGYPLQRSAFEALLDALLVTIVAGTLGYINLRVESHPAQKL